MLLLLFLILFIREEKNDVAGKRRDGERAKDRKMFLQEGKERKTERQKNIFFTFYFLLLDTI